MVVHGTGYVALVLFFLQPCFLFMAFRRRIDEMQKERAEEARLHAALALSLSERLQQVEEGFDVLLEHVLSEPVGDKGNRSANPESRARVRVEPLNSKERLRTWREAAESIRPVSPSRRPAVVDNELEQVKSVRRSSSPSSQLLVTPQRSTPCPPQSKATGAAPSSKTSKHHKKLHVITPISFLCEAQCPTKDNDGARATSRSSKKSYTDSAAAKSASTMTHAPQASSASRLRNTDGLPRRRSMTDVKSALATGAISRDSSQDSSRGMARSKSQEFLSMTSKNGSTRPTVSGGCRFYAKVVQSLARAGHFQG